ncbi:hypothetical protein CC1G_09174 [Coprinopsis cinerea okayama7|uniref:DUF6699 domain-containing protein n=1 Tax=Coprinopsis cinerea (strain Okayama-7 / 130 / ATCC MYA-4618 / FGSC 9003) TaxID=240176 RepID=A8P9U3_COPC7|nr:hypothetical protein CC1G_09174 [Coprinopsis cinerea okayama7\|eukprot:XP_001839840.1 hypothetical protein CC1G_09174 [Coprinopsis cinerea okayama7\
MSRSRRPSPAGTPFIPPLASPESSPNPPQPPVIPIDPSSSNTLPNTPSNPWHAGQYPLGSNYPAFSPAMSAHSPFFPPGFGGPTPAMGPGVLPPGGPPMGGPPNQFPPGVSADYLGYGTAAAYTPAVNPNVPLGLYGPGGMGSAPPAQGFPGVAQAYAARGVGPHGYPNPAYTGIPQPPMSAPGFGPPPGWGMPGGMGGMPGGMPGGMGGGPWGMAFNTPAPGAYQPLGGGGNDWGLAGAMAGMSLGGPGGPQQAQPPGGARNRSAYLEREHMSRVDRFATGPHYGPVLSPMLVHRLGVLLEINPLLQPTSQASGDKKYLIWNMLFPSNSARLNTDSAERSWSDGRDAPATFPRVTSLMVVSNLKAFPWAIEVKAQDIRLGVTCEEVIIQIGRSLQRLTSSKDWHWAIGQVSQQQLSAAYTHNRSTRIGVPGGELGRPMKRLDYLMDRYWWDGLQAIDLRDDEGRNVLKRYLNTENVAVTLPCLVMFKTESRQMRTEAEEQEFGQSARQRKVSQNARSRAGSRAASRAASGTGIRVESPSDSEESDSDSS